MTSPSLVILAAGKGTRFGGVKQLAEVGAGGEAVMDILLQRAAAAGITHGVVVVSPEVQEPVAAHLGARPVPDLAVELVVQARPRGTADALLAARDAVGGSCIVVNADDVYPEDAFAQLVAHLRDAPGTDHAMVAFRVARTMAGEHPGWRALLDVDPAGRLVSVREGLVVQTAGGLQFAVGASAEPMRGDEWISMNIWAFRPSVFDALADAVARFEMDAGHGEVLLPDVVAEMVGAGETIRVLHSEETCIGLTHSDDVVFVRRALS